MAAVVQQAPAEGAAERRSGAAARTVRARRWRRSSSRAARGHSLYDLPWYVIIGAPGSGKTTALHQFGVEVSAGAARREGRAARRRRHAQLRLVVHGRSGVSRHRGPLHDPGLRRHVRRGGLGRVPGPAAQVPQATARQRRHPDDQRAGPDGAGRARHAKRTSRRRAGG